MFKIKLIKLGLLVVLTLLLVNVARSVNDLWKVEREINKNQDRFSKEKNTLDELEEKLKEVQSEDYLEKVARDKLGLAKEGEVVVILPSLPLATASPTQEKEIPNWQKWWNLFL